MTRLSINSLCLWLLTSLMFAATSCAFGPVDAEETLRQAEDELRFGNIEMAASSCDLLADSTATQLSPIQLCRVAIMYAKISEQSEKEDYMASAALCFDRAIDMDNDSIDIYIESLNIEDQSYVRVIREVNRALNSPCDISKDDDFDEYEEFIPEIANYNDKPTASI